MALRVAVLGGIALTLFAIIFFRLWFLQVLSGDQYVVQARENRTREIRIPAPRGEIVDRSGRVLVDNRPSNIVKILPQDLPAHTIPDAARWGQLMGQRERRPKGKKGEPVPLPPIDSPTLERRYRRLGRVLGMRVSTIHRRVIEQLAQLPYSAVTIRADVPRSVMAYLLERKDRFKGVDVDQGFLRAYPKEELAAQLLGTVGEVSRDELKLKRNRGVKQGSVIGKAGLEYTYDRYLRGRDGARILRVDANGNFRGDPDQPLRERRPVPGRRLRLSLDLGLQEAGQQAVGQVGGGLPGAFVAMNPRDGQVYAMGSYPSFDPSVFAKPISRAKYEELNSEENGAPLFNRAIGGVYPSGSTFKPITSIAGLDAGVITPGTVINDPGCITVGNLPKCNAGKVANGGVDLIRALQVSSDVYYYKVGMDLFGLGGARLQKWAHRLGLGRKTGIDLGDESAGLIPDQEWRDKINERERECRDQPEQDGRPCYVLEMRPYNLGDNTNLAVGQGEVAISPLQMAVAYSAIAEGGRVPRPHLGLEIQDATGRQIQRIDPGPARRVKIEDSWRDAVLEGIRRAAGEPGGTSTPVFAGWPHGSLPVYGKTGTAETPQGDQSWYVAYVPHKTKPIVIATTIERGGWGADRAAPATCRMLRTWFSVDPADASCAAGDSQTR
jgi:penicillin-binding protein 2